MVHTTFHSSRTHQITLAPKTFHVYTHMHSAHWYLLIFFLETEFVIRFRKVWNESRNPFHKFPFFLWNGVWDPFHTFLKRITNSISQILIFFPRNGIRDPFQKSMNGSQNPFHKFSCFLMKRLLGSVLYFSEMDYDSVSQIFFFQKRNSWSVSKKYKTDPKIRFINLLLSNPQLRLCSIFFLTAPFFLAKKTHTIIIAAKTDNTNAVAAKVGGSPARQKPQWWLGLWWMTRCLVLREKLDWWIGWWWRRAWVGCGGGGSGTMWRVWW